MSGSGVDLEAARRGVQRQGFTEVVEAAFRRTIADLAAAAQVEGLVFQDAASAITTGAQTAVVRTLARFGDYDTPEALTELAQGIVGELAPIAWEEERQRREAALATTAGSA